jgi:hypothetical protein
LILHDIPVTISPPVKTIKVSLGFLVVGLSAYFGEPIVDWNPLTAEYLGGLDTMRLPLDS